MRPGCWLTLDQLALHAVLRVPLGTRLPGDGPRTRRESPSIRKRRLLRLAPSTSRAALLSQDLSPSAEAAPEAS